MCACARDCATATTRTCLVSTFLQLSTLLMTAHQSCRIVTPRSLSALFLKITSNWALNEPPWHPPTHTPTCATCHPQSGMTVALLIVLDDTFLQAHVSQYFHFIDQSFTTSLHWQTNLFYWLRFQALDGDFGWCNIMLQDYPQTYSPCPETPCSGTLVATSSIEFCQCFPMWTIMWGINCWLILDILNESNDEVWNYTEFYNSSGE